MILSKNTKRYRSETRFHLFLKLVTIRLLMRVLSLVDSAIYIPSWIFLLIKSQNPPEILGMNFHIRFITLIVLFLVSLQTRSVSLVIAELTSNELPTEDLSPMG